MKLVTFDGKNYKLDVELAIKSGLMKKIVPKKNAIVKFYRVSEECGYTSCRDSYEDAVKARNEIGYGNIAIEVNGRRFVIDERYKY